MAPALPKTRLDPLVRWKERELQRARLLLGERLAALSAARRRVAEAAAVLATIARTSTDAATWDLRDQAGAAGRTLLVTLGQAVSAAEAEFQLAQKGCVEANRESELFRRASERQRARLLQDIERRERRSMDELALLLRAIE